MTEKELAGLQNRLLLRRDEIIKETNSLEKDWQEMSAPQIEVEEIAQGKEITDPYRTVDETERKMIKEIDLALGKINNGTYGNCEVCGKPINLKRLKAIPWTRYCLADAERLEKPPSSVSPAVSPQL